MIALYSSVRFVCGSKGIRFIVSKVRRERYRKRQPRIFVYCLPTSDKEIGRNFSFVDLWAFGQIIYGLCGKE